MPGVEEFLEAAPAGEGALRFHVPAELHGAFGGAFGGVVAACTLLAARSVAPGRVPNALDCRFVRGLRAGQAVARASVLHAGRSLSTVSVDLHDGDDRLCTRATVSLVDAGALKPVIRSAASPGGWTPHAEAAAWGPVAPIVTTIDSRIVGSDDRGIATALQLPWDPAADRSAESACMAADMAVGPPLGSLASEGVSTPNPDLSLRFCGEVTTRELVGVGRLERAAGGIAALAVEVWSQGALVCIGTSTALLLPVR